MYGYPHIFWLILLILAADCIHRNMSNTPLKSSCFPLRSPPKTSRTRTVTSMTSILTLKIPSINLLWLSVDARYLRRSSSNYRHLRIPEGLHQPRNVTADTHVSRRSNDLDRPTHTSRCSPGHARLDIWLSRVPSHGLGVERLESKDSHSFGQGTLSKLVLCLWMELYSSSLSQDVHLRISEDILLFVPRLT